MFHFKQFSVDQNGCAMKINTDGVLLGALAEADEPEAILDLGTGTGVIALMLAQRFAEANIDAVEIDATAAETARQNFINSPFAVRLISYSTSFELYFDQYPYKQYELIVANPPFYIDALKSPKNKINLAKHANESFFKKLIVMSAKHLTTQGICSLILPLSTASLVKALIDQNELYLHKTISLYSFKDSLPHREILAFGRTHKKLLEEKFVIYDQFNVYSSAYRELLKDFLTIF